MALTLHSCSIEPNGLKSILKLPRALQKLTLIYPYQASSDNGEGTMLFSAGKPIQEYVDAIMEQRASLRYLKICRVGDSFWNPEDERTGILLGQMRSLIELDIELNFMFAVIQTEDDTVLDMSKFSISDYLPPSIEIVTFRYPIRFRKAVHEIRSDLLRRVARGRSDSNLPSLWKDRLLRSELDWEGDGHLEDVTAASVQQEFEMVGIDLETRKYPDI